MTKIRKAKKDYRELFLNAPFYVVGGLQEMNENK